MKNRIQAGWKPLAADSWQMVWPMMSIMVLEFAMNVTDVYIAGKLGSSVQATVGMVFQIYFFFTVAGYALTVGTVSVLSRLYPQQDKTAFREGVYTALVSAAILGVVLATLGILFAPQTLRVLSVPDEVKQYGIPLLQIYAGGLFFHLILIATNGILRSSKQIRLSLKTMSVVALLNIGLNIFLVYYTPLGFRGIALSTALSVAVGACINLWRCLRLTEGVRTFSRPVLGRMLKVGWPSGILAVSWQLAYTVLFLILSKLPERNIEIMAAFTTGLRVESMIYMPAFACNMANAVIIGNLLGEKKVRTAYRAGFATMGMSVGVITVMVIVVMMNAATLSGLLAANDVVVEEAVRYIMISMLSEPFMAMSLALAGALNGAGDTFGVMRIVASCLWGIRILGAYLFGIVLGYGAVAVWWSMNASIIVQSLLVLRRYRQKKWLRKR